MITIITISFVLVCALSALAISVIVLRQELNAQNRLDNLDEWLENRVLFARRMDTVGKHPAVRSRNAKVLH